MVVDDSIQDQYGPTCKTRSYPVWLGKFTLVRVSRVVRTEFVMCRVGNSVFDAAESSTTQPLTQDLRDATKISRDMQNTLGSEV